MEALLAFAAALLALRLGGLLAVRWRARRAPELAAWGAALVAYAIASAALAWGAAAGWDERGLPRVLPLRRAADRAASRARLPAAPAPPVGAVARPRLRRPRDRRCDRRAHVRRVGLEHPGGAGPPRFLPGQARRSRRQSRRHSGGRRCGNCHDQAPATRECSRPRRRRCCRRWNRSIRLGSCENGPFCGNCSTSSLRRIYSFVAH